jgi:hypothetical protein
MAYSIVCASGHVIDDELEREPAPRDNGTRRCSESGCFELTYSHCTACGRAIPGFIDGPRMVTTGNLSRPVGRLNTARGMLPAREWREDCPFCKSPYPWAPRATWAAYHRRHLEDVANGVDPALPYLAEAEKAYAAESTEHQRQARAAKRESRRATRARWSSAILDTWPGRITAIVAAIVAVLLLLFGVSNVPDLLSRNTEPTTTTTTTTP